MIFAVHVPYAVLVLRFSLLGLNSRYFSTASPCSVGKPRGNHTICLDLGNLLKTSHARSIPTKGLGSSGHLALRERFNPTYLPARLPGWSWILRSGADGLLCVCIFLALVSIQSYIVLCTEIYLARRGAAFSPPAWLELILFRMLRGCIPRARLASFYFS